jgi:hypothetical protein
MLGSRKHATKRGRGQALVEFALVAPIFVFVIFGLIEIGRAVFYQQVLDSAARDGARYGVVHGFQSLCPSGPMPGVPAPPSCDPDGSINLIPRVEERAIGVAGKASDLTVHVKWCDASMYQANPPQSTCGDYDLATSQPVPCSDWTGVGDGDNNRGQIVTVCVQYNYKPLLAGLLPIPNFSVTGRASLVVNN